MEPASNDFINEFVIDNCSTYSTIPRPAFSARLVIPTLPAPCARLWYDEDMEKKEPLKQVRIYQKEHGILRRLVMRKNLGKPKNEVTIADIIRQLIKEA